MRVTLAHQELVRRRMAQSHHLGGQERSSQVTRMRERLGQKGPGWRCRAMMPAWRRTW